MSRQKRPRGLILFEGSSLINGEKIVVIATVSTENKKTGNLIQTWILCAEENPNEAINTGHDEAICGSCPLRGVIMESAKSAYKSKRAIKGQDALVNRGRGCYVSTSSGGPGPIYGSYKKGNYPVYDTEKHAHWFQGRGIRLGAYGEPTAVPLSVWTPLVELSGKPCPGYTHRWRECDQEWRRYVMASTHSVEELKLANSMGWRSFRTIPTEDAPLESNEIHCPASELGGYTHTCESCGACNGGNVKKVGVAIVAHGAKSRLNATLRVIAEAS